MSNGNAATKKKKRIFYFDALRALAITAVILFHSAVRMKFHIWSFHGDLFNFNWLYGDFFWACMIIGVDLFLMLSGALSLGRDWSIKSFLGRRLPRIVGPFLFWAITLCSFIVLLQWQFPDLLQVLDSFTINEYLKFIYSAIMYKSPYFAPYWFFWMILGTYLIMPVFNKWLLHADLKEAEYFLAIWLISCLFDYTLNTAFPVKISYFAGPIGMVVLGYYLRYTDRKIFSNLYIPIILIILGMIGALYGSYLYTTPDVLFKFDRYSIFLVMEVTGVFLLYRNLSNVNLNIGFFSNPDGIFRKSVFSIAKYSYGFYLIHQAIMDLIIKALKYFDLFNGYKLLLLFIFVSTFIVSWIVMAVFNRIPYVNRVIGAK